jgi:hypothetical protein
MDEDNIWKIEQVEVCPRLNFAYHSYKATNYMYGGEIDNTLYMCCLETRLASNNFSSFE